MYNWKQNKGYPTLEHREKIKQFGITDLHRKSFNLADPQLKLNFEDWIKPKGQKPFLTLNLFIYGVYQFTHLTVHAKALKSDWQFQSQSDRNATQYIKGITFDGSQYGIRTEIRFQIHSNGRTIPGKAADCPLWGYQRPDCPNHGRHTEYIVAGRYQMVCQILRYDRR